MFFFYVVSCHMFHSDRLRYVVAYDVAYRVMFCSLALSMAGPVLGLLLSDMLRYVVSRHVVLRCSACRVIFCYGRL